MKDFLLFKKIFENAQGTFSRCSKKLNSLKDLFNLNENNMEPIFSNKDFKNIFKNIKEELGRKSENKS